MGEMISQWITKFGVASIATSFSVKAAEITGLVDEVSTSISLSDYALIVSLIGGLLLIANTIMRIKTERLNQKLAKMKIEQHEKETQQGD